MLIINCSILLPMHFYYAFAYKKDWVKQPHERRKICFMIFNLTFAKTARFSTKYLLQSRYWFMNDNTMIEEIRWV